MMFTAAVHPEPVEGLITDHLDLWIAAIKRKSAAGRGSSSKVELYGIKKLRELILELAVRGLLVPQDPNDEPASELLKKIAAEKAKLSKAGKFKKDTSLAPVDTKESPFELPDGWLWERFGNLAEHNAGKTLDSGRNQGELRDYITTSNLYWGRFDLSGVRQMPIEDADLEKCLAIKNDLLICEGGEAGRAAVWKYDHSICFQNHIHRARFWQGINPYFAYRLLEKMSFSGEINDYRKGVGISNMSGKALGSIPFPLPPLAEQHRIVAKVDELMALCDQLGQQTDANLNAHQTLVEILLNALTSAADHAQFASSWQRIAEHFDTLFTTEESINQLKQTLLQLAVMGKLVPQDPNDEPASELLKKIAADKAKLVKEGSKKEKSQRLISEKNRPFEVPEGWVWAQIHQLFDVTSGGSFDAAAELDKGQYPYVKVADMNIPGNDLFITTSSRFINPTAKELRGAIQANSIIFPKRGGAIATNKKRLVTSEIFADLNIMAITVPSKISLIYAFYWLCGIDLALLNTGTSVPQINHKDIEPLDFPLPPLAEQHRIVAKVDELMALCDQLKSRLSDAQTTQLHLADTIVEQAVC